jgi:hypothetical protein
MVPAAVSDAILARGAVLSFSEEFGVVSFVWWGSVGEVDRDAVAGGEFAGKVFLDGFESERS